MLPVVQFLDVGTPLAVQLINEIWTYIPKKSLMRMDKTMDKSDFFINEIWTTMDNMGLVINEIMDNHGQYGAVINGGHGQLWTIWSSH